MKLEQPILTPDECDELQLTALVIEPLGEQYRNREQAHETAALGMWVFLVTEVMFFAPLFLGLAAYRFQFPDAFERASEKLNWVIGGINTVVLLVSSLFMVLAVHEVKCGRQKRVVNYLLLTALLGVSFLFLKAYEYYTDYRDNLIPGWRFVDSEWISEEGLAPGQKPLTPAEVPHVKLFLVFYWFMTALHGVHVTIGIGVVLVIAHLAHRRHFSPSYYTPVDVTALYWHFVDTVWIFLLPMLYLLGTHTWAEFHF
jgi:cytochrome c oxidase subunit III